MGDPILVNSKLISNEAKIYGGHLSSHNHFKFNLFFLNTSNSQLPKNGTLWGVSTHNFQKSEGSECAVFRCDLGLPDSYFWVMVSFGAKTCL